MKSASFSLLKIFQDWLIEFQEFHCWELFKKKIIFNFSTFSATWSRNWRHRYDADNWKVVWIWLGMDETFYTLCSGNSRVYFDFEENMIPSLKSTYLPFFSHLNPVQLSFISLDQWDQWSDKNKLEPSCCKKR